MRLTGDKPTFRSASMNLSRFEEIPVRKMKLILAPLLQGSPLSTCRIAADGKKEASLVVGVRGGVNAFKNTTQFQRAFTKLAHSDCKAVRAPSTAT